MRLYEERRSGPLLSAVRSFSLHFFVHMHHTLFYGPVLRQPDDKVDNKEYSEIQDASKNTVSDSVHQIGDGEGGKGTDDKMGNALPEQTPLLLFPDQ